ncbi:MAG TPA: winged helix-turn-helix transcriptional regulator [Gemmataceae bacterium]
MHLCDERGRNGCWKVLVIHYLLDGTKRFGELHRGLTGISHRTLAERLREREAGRLIRRQGKYAKRRSPHFCQPAERPCCSTASNKTR